MQNCSKGKERIGRSPGGEIFPNLQILRTQEISNSRQISDGIDAFARQEMANVDTMSTMRQESARRGELRQSRLPKFLRQTQGDFGFGRFDGKDGKVVKE